MRISDWSSDVCSSDLFVEDLVQGGVERLRGGQVAAERLFDHYPRAPGATAGVERPDHGREQARRDRQVVQRVFGGAQFLAQALEGAGVVVVADRKSTRLHSSP